MPRGGVLIATTRLIAIHHAKGKSAADCISDSLDYIMNPAKTDNGKYVTCYECQPETAKAEFILSKRIYEDTSGRTRGKYVLLYQIRQSFRPGEVTPEQAHKIAYELAWSFTKGKHAFVVATHTDKAHIHTHIDFNSTSLDGTKSFVILRAVASLLHKYLTAFVLKMGFSLSKTQNALTGIMANGLAMKSHLLTLTN